MKLDVAWHNFCAKLKYLLIDDGPTATVHAEPEGKESTAAADHHHAEKVDLSHCFEQSPIDIQTKSVAELSGPDMEEIMLKVGSTAAEIVKDGHNFTVFWKDREQNYLMINGKVYYTVQFHFHTPSEHTVNGKHQDMELHLVNQADDGSLAVVGLFFRVGAENKFLSQFWDQLPGMNANKNNKVTLNALSAAHLTLLTGEFFRYRGSLTTPPYSEGVEWVVMRDVAEASVEQIDLFYKSLGRHNARDVQALNKRDVHLCTAIAG